LVATNTTTARPSTSHPVAHSAYGETGGLSGRPLRGRSTEVIRHLFRQTRGRLPIIGVGGIFNAHDAWEKVTAGASLVQVYTGMVYQGPDIAKKIVTGLARRLNRVEGRQWSQIVGSAPGADPDPEHPQPAH
jgi:dihydroorotate dehydrogenase